jgi:hypothetical protein
LPVQARCALYAVDVSRQAFFAKKCEFILKRLTKHTIRCDINHSVGYPVEVDAHFRDFFAQRNCFFMLLVCSVIIKANWLFIDIFLRLFHHFYPFHPQWIAKELKKANDYVVINIFWTQP